MKTKQLSAVAKIIAGQSPPSETYNTIGEGLAFFQGKADFQTKFPKIRIWCSSKSPKEAFPGDILMSVRAPVGPVNVCNQHAAIGRGISAIRPLTGTYGDYLYYFLKSNEEFIASLGTGSTFKAITQQTLAKIQIPFPEFDDQIRIATLLSRVEALIATRKDNLRLLDEFLKATFLEMFGDPERNEKDWKCTEIQNVCTEIVDCVNKTAPEADQETPFFMIRTSNIKNGKISLKNVKCVSEETYKIWTRRSIPKKGDILLTREAPMGEAAIIDFDQSIFLGQRIMQYRLNLEEMQPLYLLHLMRTRYFNIQIEKLGKGSTVKHLTVPDCFKFTIPSPPIELQNQFATIVEKTESLKTHYQQNLSELENLYAALSQQAFKGELDLSRVPLPEQAIHHEGHEDHEENNTENLRALRDLRGEPAQPPVLPSNLIQLFEDFISKQSGDFSLASFWQIAEQSLLESTDEDLKPWSVADYDQVKQRLFELVKNGNIRQHFNETNNQIELNSTGGG